MNEIVPGYISQLAHNIKTKNQSVTFDLECKCGCNKFLVFKNKPEDYTDNEFDQYWNKIKVPILSIQSSIEKKTGRSYVYGQTFLGIHVGKFYIDNLPVVSSIDVLKIKCAQCGEEYIIFDSRKHGYDAFVNKENSIDNEVVFEKKIIKSGIESIGISMNIRNDLSYSEFLDEIGESFDYQTYTDAFSDITVYAKINDKKKALFSMERA